MTASEPNSPARPPRPERTVERPIGAREHYVGIGILSAVILFCTWVLIRGLAPPGVLWGANDPSLFAASTTPATPGPEPVERVDEPPVAAPAASPDALLPVPLDGWSSGTVETFTADNLYEKINGRAEAYLAYGVQGLEVVAYTRDDQGVDLFIYDLGEPLLAFGMFGSERFGDEPPVELGRGGYQAGGSVYFWQDRYYVQAIAANGVPEEAEAALKLAGAVAAKLPTSDVKLPGEDWFPTENLQSRSLAYVREKALGQEWLHDVYTARYQLGETMYDVFLAKRADPAAAAADYSRYLDYLKGTSAITELSAAEPAMIVAEQSGPVDVIFQSGPFFGGVTYSSDPEGAKTIAKQLAAAVEK